MPAFQQDQAYERRDGLPFLAAGEQLLSHDRAVVVGDHSGLLNAQRMPDRGDQIGLLEHAVTVPRRLRGPAEAEEVERQHAVVLLQAGSHCRPFIRGGREPVQQCQPRSGPAHSDVHVVFAAGKRHRKGLAVSPPVIQRASRGAHRIALASRAQSARGGSARCSPRTCSTTVVAPAS